MKSVKEQNAELLKEAYLADEHSHKYEDAFQAAADLALNKKIKELTGLDIYVNHGQINGISYNSVSDLKPLSARYLNRSIQDAVDKTANQFVKKIHDSGLSIDELKTYYKYKNYDIAYANHEGNGKFGYSRDYAAPHAIMAMLQIAGYDVDTDLVSELFGKLSAEYMDIPGVDGIQVKQFLNNKIQFKGLTEEQIKEIEQVQELLRTVKL